MSRLQLGLSVNVMRRRTETMCETGEEKEDGGMGDGGWGMGDEERKERRAGRAVRMKR